MIKPIIKSIVSTFLSAVSIVLFLLWLLFGSLVLLALIIRLISLYTIALLNSFVSSTPITYNYTKAIEDVIDMYINTYIKILSIPLLPWKPFQEKDNSSFRALLDSEMYELKKSWAITLIVFVSYILSFSFSLAMITSKKEEKINKVYETEVSNLKADLSKYEVLSSDNEAKYIDLKVQIITSLYKERRWRVETISKVMDLPLEQVIDIIDKNNITR